MFSVLHFSNREASCGACTLIHVIEFEELDQVLHTYVPSLGHL